MESSSQPNQSLLLKKGDLLFKEGDKSRAMYLLKSGMIRLFARKGTSNIEIDTIHSGQILGELAFLDGNPRSLSGEALTDCELAEISGPVFMDVLNKTPDWLKILLKTVVGRLRAANTRIKQLESSNVSINYSDRDGAKKSAYQFLSTLEFIRASTAFLIVGTRQGKKSDQGIDVDLGLVNRYSFHIMGVPFAKSASTLDILVQTNLATQKNENGNPRAYLQNIESLEQVILFLTDENQLEPNQRHTVSTRGLAIMKSIIQQISTTQSTSNQKNLITFDLSPLRQGNSSERDRYRDEEFGELVKATYISELKTNSQNQLLTQINPVEFLKNFQFMRILSEIKSVNLQKQEVGNSKRD
jgi:CRP-like cAMP-binding protein